MGAFNDIDPPTSLQIDVCTKAENIEYFYSALGERRGGCVGIGLPSQITGDSNQEAVVWMMRHLPDNTLGTAELWVLSQGLDNNNYSLNRRNQTAWSNITPNDPITIGPTYIGKLSGLSLHGKLYIAHKSAMDRLHVWDGSTLRRVGMAAPVSLSAPTNTGSGSFTGQRFYRVRFIAMTGSVVNRRSEPCPQVAFTPSGSGSGVIILKPSAVNEGETHWELEASIDGTNFYVIATLTVATASYTDAQPYASDYAPLGPLSEDLTSYTLVPSGKYLTGDADRLIVAGSWENPTYASRIWWTPVLANTGVGNDERLDMTVNPFVDLDGYEGGEITGITHPVNGYLYVFKWSHIYKMVRTGQLTNAYDVTPLTTARGALPGSLVEAVDQFGKPAQYFLDPSVGPMRISSYGMEWCGADLRNFWTRVNQAATVPAHGVFYQAKNQVHFWVAVDGSDYPNAKIVVHCGEIQSGVGGARRGWVTVPVGNRISDAYCSLMFSPNVDSTDARNQILVPFIGKKQWTVNGSTIKNLIQRCDVGSTDCFTVGDTQAYYYSSVQSRPLSPVTYLNQFGVMAGVLLVGAVPNATNNVHLELIRDFGVETKLIDIDISQQGSETIQVKQLDNLSMAQFKSVQMAFGDLDTTIFPTTQWQLQMFVAKVTGEQTS